MNIHEYQAKSLLQKYGVPDAARPTCIHAGRGGERGARTGQRRSSCRQVADPRRRPRRRPLRRTIPDGKGGVRICKSLDEVKEESRKMLGHDPGHQADRAGGQGGQAALHRGRLRHRPRALSQPADRPGDQPDHRDGVDRGRHGDRGGRRQDAGEDHQGGDRPGPGHDALPRAADRLRPRTRGQAGRLRGRFLLALYKAFTSSTPRWWRSTRWSSPAPARSSPSTPR